MMSDTAFAPVPVVETELSPCRNNKAASSIGNNAECDDTDTVASTPPRQSGTTRTHHHHHHHPQFRTTYRGGFATSICDLFSNPYDRSSFCALVCCGVFLQDRTQYILNGNLPPTLWRVRLPILVALLVTLILASTYGHPIPFVVLVIVLSARGTLLRMKTRKHIMNAVVPEHYRRQQQQQVNFISDDENNDDGSCCQSCCADHRRAHRCCAFVPLDVIYEPVSSAPADESLVDTSDNDTRSNNNALFNNNDDYDDYMHHQQHQHYRKDSCYYLWRFLASSCCGSCGCWCNCCGMCATAQEDREMRRHYPRDKFMMDYITMQPYAEYYPAIQELRESAVSGSGAHVRAMSKLSISLCRIMGLCLLVMLAVSAFHIFSNFRLVNLIVVLLTLFQASAVVYLVHWRNHRFDLSLDAVVKYFASGFILAASVAIMIELITGLIGDLGAFVLLVFTMDKNEDISKETQEEVVEENLAVLVLFIFFQAFVSAALVEELTKFFCFWIVEHPDLSFIPQDPLNTTGQDSNRDLEEDEQTFAWDVNSKAAAVTVGMVTTAAGFACMENLMYSLGVGKSVSTELVVLLIRAGLPAHPVCAAIQSIGIVQRDIERDSSMDLGRVIFPAVLLHGTFDFVVMLVGVLTNLSDKPLSDSTVDDSNVTVQEVIAQNWLSCVAGLVVLLAGVVYYAIEAKKQRDRLSALEATRASNNALV